VTNQFVDPLPTAPLVLLVVMPVFFLLDLAGAVVAIRLWRARPPGAPVRSITSLYLAVTVVVTVLALFAVLDGLLVAFGSIGESFDPSQKALIVDAKALSEAINVTAFATVVATPLAIAVLIHAWRRRRVTARQ
jgi:hypothetical protein